MKSDTEKLIKAMRVLARDIQSDDGAANAAIAEAAVRLQEQQERIKRLENAVSAALQNCYDGPMPDYVRTELVEAKNFTP